MFRIFCTQTFMRLFSNRLLPASAVVKRLKVLQEEQQLQPLNDNTIEVAHFCRGLEAVLRHQQKGVCEERERERERSWASGLFTFSG